MFLRGENVGESFLTTFRDKLNLFQGDCGSKHFCFDLAFILYSLTFILPWDLKKKQIKTFKP